MSAASKFSLSACEICGTMTKQIFSHRNFISNLVSSSVKIGSSKIENTVDLLAQNGSKGAAGVDKQNPNADEKDKLHPKNPAD